MNVLSQASGNLQVSNEDAPVIRVVNALICRAKFRGLRLWPTWI